MFTSEEKQLLQTTPVQDQGKDIIKRTKNGDFHASRPLLVLIYPVKDQKLTMVSQFVVSAATPTTVRIISTQKPEKVGSKEKLKNVRSFFKPRSYRHFFYSRRSI